MINKYEQEHRQLIQRTRLVTQAAHSNPEAGKVAQFSGVTMALFAIANGLNNVADAIRSQELASPPAQSNVINFPSGDDDSRSM